VLKELYLPGNQLAVFEFSKEEVRRYRHPKSGNSMQHAFFKNLRRPELYQV